MMPTFYVTPVVLSLLSVLTVAVGVLFYLLSLKNKSPATKWMTTGVCAGMLLVLTALLQASIATPYPYFEQFSYWLEIGGITFFAALIQHSYHHPHLRREQRAEARLVRWLSIGFILFAALLSTQAAHLRPGALHRGALILLIVSLVVWIILSLRQLYYYARQAQITDWRNIWLSPIDPLVRNFRLFVIIALSSIPTTAVTAWAILSHLDHGFYSLLLATFFAVVIFVGTFSVMNHLAEPTTLLYKLASMALLLLFLMANSIAYFTSPMLNLSYQPPPTVSTGDHYRLDRELNQELDREREASYHLYPLLNSGNHPAQAQVLPPGEPLALSNNSWQEIDLGFNFPFFDHVWQTLFVTDNGYVSFVQPMVTTYPGLTLNNREPVIAPLLVDFVPERGGAVYLQRTDESVIITWYQLQMAFADTQSDATKSSTVQLTLWANGDIAFSYPQLNLKRTLASDMALQSWFVGITPGDYAPSRLTHFTAGVDERITERVGLLQNFNTEARIYSDHWLRPFAYLTIAAGLMILLGFPFFLRRTVVSPLAQLMTNVERVDAGDLSVATHIRSNDEIGYLADAFNRMVISIRGAQQELQTINQTLETRVQERTAELVVAKEAAEASNQAKSRFLATMSHELRTPLNAILGYTQLLQEQEIDNAYDTHNHTDSDALPTNSALRGKTTDVQQINQQQRALQIIHQSGEHLLTLLNDILDLSRIEAGKEQMEVTSITLAPFTQQIARMIELQAQSKALTFVYQADSTLPERVELDARLVRQVLINLLHNAIKFTEHGQITLIVEEVSLTEAKESPVPNPMQRTLRFTVRDTGRGIPVRDIDKIFGAFEQADNQSIQQMGVGLGLAISQRLLHLMQSHLQVKSTVGEGSTFWFDLPVEVVDSASQFMVAGSNRHKRIPSGIATDQLVGPNILPNGSQDPRKVSQGYRTDLRGYHGPRQRALIVDDNANNRDVLNAMLTRLGFAVIQSPDGHDAVARAVELAPALILMDLVMPEMDGLTAVSQIRAQPSLQKSVIFAVSASVFAADLERSLAAGFNDFLPKPVRLQRLHELLQQHLAFDWIKETKTIDTFSHQSLTNHTINGLEDAAAVNAAISPVLVRQEILMQTPLAPSLADLQQLYTLTILGDIQSLRKHLTDLREQNIVYIPFVDEVAKYMADFQLGKLQTWLESYMAK